MTEEQVKALVDKYSQPVFNLIKRMNTETNQVLNHLELDAKVSKIRVKEIAIELGVDE